MSLLKREVCIEKADHDIECVAQNNPSVDTLEHDVKGIVEINPTVDVVDHCIRDVSEISQTVDIVDNDIKGVVEIDQTNDIVDNDIESVVEINQTNDIVEKDIKGVVEINQTVDNVDNNIKGVVEINQTVDLVDHDIKGIIEIKNDFVEQTEVDQSAVDCESKNETLITGTSSSVPYKVGERTEVADDNLVNCVDKISDDVRGGSDNSERVSLGVKTDSLDAEKQDAEKNVTIPDGNEQSRNQNAGEICEANHLPCSSEIATSVEILNNGTSDTVDEPEGKQDSTDSSDETKHAHTSNIGDDNAQDISNRNDFKNVESVDHAVTKSNEVNGNVNCNNSLDTQVEISKSVEDVSSIDGDSSHPVVLRFKGNRNKALGASNESLGNAAADGTPDEPLCRSKKSAQDIEVNLIDDD